MLGSLKLVVGLIGVFWLAIAGAAGMALWDRRSAGEPSINVPVLFFHLRWTAPDSLAAKAAEAQARVDALTSAVAAMSALSVRATTEAETAVRRDRAGAATVARRLVILRRPVSGADDCARARMADRALMETLAP